MQLREGRKNLLNQQLSLGLRGLLRKHVAGIFLVALLIRLAVFCLISNHPNVILQPDSKMYVSLAEGLLTQGTFSYPDKPTVPDAERMPGYPLFISVISRLFGGHFPGLIVVQMVMDALSCVLVYRLGESLWMGAGFASGFLAAVNLGMIAYSHFILNDSFFLFSFLLVFLGLVKFLRGPDWKTSILLGIGAAAAAMVRPVIIYLPLLILPFCLGVFYIRSGRLALIPLCKVMLLGLIVLVCLLPWSLRNNNLYGRLNLTAQSGEHLLQYIVPFTWQYSRGIPFIEGMKEANLQFSEKMKAEQIDVNKLNPFEKSDLQMRMAIDILRAEPVTAIMKAWLFGMIKNLFSPGIIDLSYLLGIERPHFFYTEGTTTLERAWNFIRGMKGWFGWAVVANIVVLLLSRIIQVWGLMQLMRRKPWEAGLFVLIIAYFLLISGPVGYAKYRLPFEPILIVLLAIGLKDLKDRWRLPRRSACGISATLREAKQKSLEV